MSKSTTTPGTELMSASEPSVAPQVVGDVSVQGAQAKLAARLYSTSASPSAATVADSLIVFFHQGGFVGGSLDESDEFVRALAIGTGLPVLSASYRGYLPRAADLAHPYASPLQSSRLKGLPAALILSAQEDPLRDEAEQYGARLIAAGIKTLVKRLAPVPLQDGPARCRCAREHSALGEIAAFIAGL